MLNFQELIDRNYATVERRGQLSDSSDKLISKIEDEVKELRESWCNGPHVEFDPSEAIDVILSSCTMLKHFGHDIPELLTKKVEYNEHRKD